MLLQLPFLQATPWCLASLVMHLAWEQCQQLVGALQHPGFCDQAGKSVGSKRGLFSSPAWDGDMLAAYLSCPVL